MKTNLINALIKYFMEKGNYNLINANEENLDLINNTIGLIKVIQGTTVFVEIIDADRYDVRDIMENGSYMLENVNGQNAYIFKLFLFDNAPSEHAINIMTSGQKDNIQDKKFLKCISVNVSNKSVCKYFTKPTYDAHIVRNLNKFFDKKLDENETTIEDISNLIEKRNKDFEIQLKAKTPWVTYALIAANVIVWLILKIISIQTNTNYDNLLVPYGAKVNSLISNGEYWRFLTAMFLHGNEVHLLVNCYSLYMVGSQVEKLFGHINMTVIYFVAGLLGSVSSFAFSPNVSVGASGAIFGLLGAMFYFAIKRPSLLKSSFGINLVTTLIINLVYGAMNPRIDNYAHLGGLVGGFLSTGAVYTSKEETSKDKISRIIALILISVVSLGGLYYSFNNEQNKYATKISALVDYNDQQKYTEAEKLAKQILEQNPKDNDIKISALKNLVISEVSQNKYAESEEHAEELLKYNITSETKTQILWYLCLSEASQGNNKFAEAEEHANQLIKVSPVHGHFLLGVIYYNTQDINNLDKAKEHLQKAKELNSPNMDAINSMLSNIEELQKKK